MKYILVNVARLLQFTRVAIDTFNQRFLLGQKKKKTTFQQTLIPRVLQEGSAFRVKPPRAYIARSRPDLWHCGAQSGQVRSLCVVRCAEIPRARFQFYPTIMKTSMICWAYSQPIRIFSYHFYWRLL